MRHGCIRQTKALCKRMLSRDQTGLDGKSSDFVKVHSYRKINHSYKWIQMGEVPLLSGSNQECHFGFGGKPQFAFKCREVAVSTLILH
eukprot:s702_g9.t1